MDVTDATFETDVVERSATTPVVVDLWAEWCGPCKTLGPMLEQAVAETDGKVALAKVDIDHNPAVAQAFRVQSIPAVFAFKDRQVVDSFIGALPEAQVRAFVSSLAPAKSEADLLAERGDEESLRRALALLERVPESADTRRVAALARVGNNAVGVARTGEIEVKLDSLLERVKDDDAARQEFVDLLEVMGPDDPRTSRYRKALTARLF